MRLASILRPRREKTTTAPVPDAPDLESLTGAMRTLASYAYLQVEIGNDSPSAKVFALGGTTEMAYYAIQSFMNPHADEAVDSFLVRQTSARVQENLSRYRDYPNIVDALSVVSATLANKEGFRQNLAKASDDQREDLKTVLKTLPALTFGQKTLLVKKSGPATPGKAPLFTAFTRVLSAYDA